MRKRRPDFARRLAPLLLTRDLRSGGGGGASSSSSSSSALRLADFFRFSSASGIRSLGSRRRSAMAAASPNRGSLRPPLFFRPHAIRKCRSHRSPPYANRGTLRAGYREVNAGLGAKADRARKPPQFR